MCWFSDEPQELEVPLVIMNCAVILLLTATWSSAGNSECDGRGLLLINERWRGASAASSGALVSSNICILWTLL